MISTFDWVFTYCTVFLVVSYRVPTQHGSHSGAINTILDELYRILFKDGFNQTGGSSIASLSAQSHLISISHAKHTTTAATRSLTSLCSILHLFRDFDVDLEEFGDAAVETDALPFAQVGFTIIGRDAF